MHRCLISLLLFWVFVGGGVSAARAQDIVRAAGAVALALPMSDAVTTLRTEKGIDMVLRAGGGTETGLDALGTHVVDLALCSRNLTPVDRAEYPRAQLNDTLVGIQLLALCVSRDVWVGGLRSLSADQIRGIYEGRIHNWKEVGGPDVRIRLYMPERGRGVWELFVQWLYEGIRKAPLWDGSKVKSLEEARNMIEFTPGSCTLLPPSMTDYRNLYALAIADGVNAPVQPTVVNTLSGKYPLGRPLLLVTDDKPAGPVKMVVDFMLSDRGQGLVKKYGYVSLEEIAAAQAKK